MRSYCDSDDGDCCANAVGAPQAHLQYPSEYDDDALQFVIGKYNAYKATHKMATVMPTVNGILGGTPVNLAQVAANNGFY